MSTPSLPPAARSRLGALRSGAIPLGLGVLCFVLAFVQRPGRAYDDTRIELSADPGLFLHRVSALWSPTFDLGHVQSGQFVGYLFPMGAWYAFAHWIGIPTWVFQRLWLGALLALAAWGAVRLMDELFERSRGAAHLAAGLVYAINPYVVIYFSRGSATLIAYAALPWLLIAAHRGLRTPRGWGWPAFGALVFTSAAGGVNAALVVWIALAPLALLAYEAGVLGRAWREVWSLVWRAGTCALLASLWWLVPVALQTHYGSDFLRFTEQPASIFATTSMSETVRLLGLWVSYFSLGIGHTEPTVAAIGTYLNDQPVVIASFLTPLFAFGGLIFTRRFTYAPFFGLLAVATVVVMAIGFPLSSPLSHALTDLYYELSPVRFLRTTYKAAPLLALSTACLAGATTSLLVAQARSGKLWILRSRVTAWALPAMLLPAVLWALPLFEGRAIDRPLAYGHIPSTWTRAIADAQHITPSDRRLMVLPGELFGWYRWGGTWTSIAPALAHRPVLIREISRYADPRAAQLQDVVDDQIGQARLVPGQLRPLLQLMGVGGVIVANDGSRTRSAALDPARLSQALADQTGLSRPLASYGRPRTYAPDPGFGGDPVSVPDLQLYSGPGATGPGIVRVHPLDGGTILDGDAHGIAELAAMGRLDTSSALQYAADLTADDVRRRVQAGAALVFTDSNQRREVLGSELQANQGVTLGATDPIPRDQATYDLFPRRGSNTQTVATYSGLRYLRAPESPGFGVFPQNRAYAAFDGRTDTAWIADAQSPRERYLELALTHPRRVFNIWIHPHEDPAGRTVQVGVTVNGGVEHVLKLSRGWNRVRLLGVRLRTLRLRVLKVAGGLLLAPGLGGLDEVRIPGLRVHESLRLPTTLATQTRGLSLAKNPIEILMERATADFPYRPRAPTANLQTVDGQTMLDPEASIEREFLLPDTRSFNLDGWASVSPTAPDHLLDQLAGLTPAWRFDSSGRFEGVPSRRASAAFDDNPASAWIAPRAPGQEPWLQWQGPKPITLRRLRLLPGPPEYAFPTRVRIATDLGTGPELNVTANGLVALPRRIRTRTVRIVVIGVRPPSSARERKRRLRAVAVGEVLAPGLQPPPIRVDPRASFATPCGAIRVAAGGTSAAARVVGTLGDLEIGRGLRMLGCGPTLRLARGWVHVSAGPGVAMRPDYLRLSAGSQPRPPAASIPPAVVSAGHAGDGFQRGVRLALSRPSWLVSGQSYSPGWRAWCRDARSRELALGAPVPIDGFASGWPVPASCKIARFAFTPQGAANVSYAIAAAAVLAMLVIMLAGAIRRGRSLDRAATPPLIAWAPPSDPLIRLSWGASIAVAAVALLLGGLEAWRVGVALALLALVLAREGASASRLLILGAIGLAALPAMYVLEAPPKGLGAAFPFSFPARHLSAHWVAVAAIACLGAGCALDAWRLRARRSSALPGAVRGP